MRNVCRIALPQSGIIHKIQRRRKQGGMDEMSEVVAGVGAGYGYGYGGGGIGAILVLFILLVIISKAFFF